MSRRTYAGLVTDWQKLLAGGKDNAADLPQLETIRTDLQEAYDLTVGFTGERKSLQAQSAQLTRNLEDITLRGRDLAIKFRAGVKSHYGATSEKLSQFDMKPIRRKLKVQRKRKKTAAGDPPPATAPQQTSAASPQQPGATQHQAAAPSPAEGG